MTEKSGGTLRKSSASPGLRSGDGIQKTDSLLAALPPVVFGLGLMIGLLVVLPLDGLMIGGSTKMSLPLAVSEMPVGVSISVTLSPVADIIIVVAVLCALAVTLGVAGWWNNSAIMIRSHCL